MRVRLSEWKFSDFLVPFGTTRVRQLCEARLQRRISDSGILLQKSVDLNQLTTGVGETNRGDKTRYVSGESNRRNPNQRVTEFE